MSELEPTSLTVIDALLEAAEFSPTAEQKAEILDAYPHVRKMLERLKRDYGFQDEPAHVYAPSKF